jgi:hypothetical protein
VIEIIECDDALERIESLELPIDGNDPLHAVSPIGNTLYLCEGAV